MESNDEVVVMVVADESEAELVCALSRFSVVPLADRLGGAMGVGTPGSGCTAMEASTNAEQQQPLLPAMRRNAWCATLNLWLCAA